MSLSHLYDAENIDNIMSTVYSNTVDTKTLTAETLNISALTADSIVTDTLEATSAQVNEVLTVVDSLQISNKGMYTGNLNTLSFAVTHKQGIIKLVANVAFPNGDALNFTISNPDITTNDIPLLTWGPCEVPTDSPLQQNLGIGIVSINTGNIVVSISNDTGVNYAGTNIEFTYLIV